jgi:hypothetical protein
VLGDAIMPSPQGASQALLVKVQSTSVNEHVRKVIDDAPEVPDLIVARARYTLESSYELDVNDPNIMLAAMAGAALVAHLADQLLALHAMPPSTAAAVVKLAQSAEFAFAQGFRFVERETAPGD